MDSIQQRDLTTTALRLAVQDLDAAIECVRRKHRKFERINGKNYLRQVRDVFELQEKAKALGSKGPLVEDMKPEPYRGQIVGRSPSEKFKLEWKDVFNRFPFPPARSIRKAA